MQVIRLIDLHAHPQNPRLAPRDDVVQQIAAQIVASGEFDPAHALIVRKNAAGFEIVSGHHRKLAAEKAGLEVIPCWVRELSDEDAYMALALNNAQGELSPLEVGLHQIHSGVTIRDYAKRIGIAEATLGDRVKAARVAAGVMHMHDDHWRALAVVHAAPAWLWPALVERLVAEGWTVEKTRSEVKRIEKATEPPKWVRAAPTLKKLAEAIVAGTVKPDISAVMTKVVKETIQQIRAEEIEAGDFEDSLDQCITNEQPIMLSDLAEIVNSILDAQYQKVIAYREARQKALRASEERIARIARLRSFVSLEEWNKLTPVERDDVMSLDGVKSPGFNKQTGSDIEWAQWSWNPITGCLHDCSYCYARDIAHQKRMSPFYPHGFAPTLRPAHLLAPTSTAPPSQAKSDARYRNVFAGSMADMFGRWVPREWIEAVLAQMRAAPQWTFLCLTKFPKRMSEFDLPPNIWMGTSVDLQARVPAAEAGFAKTTATVKWLSVEPMLEPLEFKRLDLFDWIVIGGASASSKTPEWHPPSGWIFDLKRQARDAGVAIYEKSNLWSSSTPRTLELPGGLPVTLDPDMTPHSSLQYLGRAKSADQKTE